MNGHGCVAVALSWAGSGTVRSFRRLSWVTACATAAMGMMKVAFKRVVRRLIAPACYHSAPACTTVTSIRRIFTTWAFDGPVLFFTYVLYHCVIVAYVT